MDKIVGVHGIGKYHYYRDSGNSVAGAATAMRDKWDRYLHKGLTGDKPYAKERYITEVAYYAHLLGESKDEALLAVQTMDVGAQKVFVAWAKQVDSMGEGLTGALHRMTGWLLDHMQANAADFAKLFCPEVAAYMAAGGEARAKSRAAVAEVIRRNRPKVVIAHSLGSVVTYETLWANPDLEVDLLITLGSPLGMRNVIFEHLMPAPVNGWGERPRKVKRWVNIADKDDIVAIPPGLRGCFTGVDQEALVNLDWLDFHTVEKYLGCGALNSHLKPYL
jgi:predicted alpha/beta hydrolase family esterase